jgi:hypothetical protein
MSANLPEALSQLAKQHAAVALAEEKFRRLVPKPGGVAINLRPLDLVMLAAVHRSRRLLEAAQMLCDSRNTIALDPLIRLQVDTLLRVNAVQHEKDPGAVEIALCTGETVRKLKTLDGKKMYDKELVDRLNNDLPWTREIYEKYCDAVHFSTDHLVQSLREAFLAPSEIGTDGKTHKQFVDERLCEAVSHLLMVTEPIVVAAMGYLEARRTHVPEPID